MKFQELNLNPNFFNGMGFIIFSFMIFLTFFGCGATKAVKMNQAAIKEAYQIQKPFVVWTSEEDGRPEWTKNTMAEGEGKMYFSGGFINGADYSLSIRCANAEAIKVVLQGISQYIRAEFSSYVQGSNSTDGSIDRYVEDGLATFAENLHIQGIRQKQVYYEEIFAASEMQPAFNVWVRLEMDKADYLKAKADVLRNLRDKFADAGPTEAKEKAEKLLEDLKNGIKSKT
jgi:hypothetical protein